MPDVSPIPVVPNECLTENISRCHTRSSFLTCSSLFPRANSLSPPLFQDPLDQIHEGSDGDITTEVSDAEADSRKKGPARVDGDRGTEDSSDPQQQQKLPIVYLERAVPLRDSIMWKLQR